MSLLPLCYPSPSPLVPCPALPCPFHALLCGRASVPDFPPPLSHHEHGHKGVRELVLRVVDVLEGRPVPHGRLVEEPHVEEGQQVQEEDVRV